MVVRPGVCTMLALPALTAPPVGDAMAKPPQASIKATGTRRQTRSMLDARIRSDGPLWLWADSFWQLLPALEWVFPFPATCSEVAMQVPVAGLQRLR